MKAAALAPNMHRVGATARPARTVEWDAMGCWPGLMGPRVRLVIGTYTVWSGPGQLQTRVTQRATIFWAVCVVVSAVGEALNL